MTVYAFISYPRESDATDNVTRFATLFRTEVQLLGLRAFGVLLDRTDIAWGQKWRTWISERPKDAAFLIPFASPAYFQSAACGKEYEAFCARERELGLKGYVLPILYVPFEVENEPNKRVKKWKKSLLSHHYVDFSTVRHEIPDGPRFRHAIAEMASALVSTHRSFAVANPERATSAGSAEGRKARSSGAPGREEVEFQIVGKEDRSTLIIGPDQAFELIYTPILEHDFAKYKLVREKFEEHVVREVTSHQAMLKYDYVSRAIPLPEGITVFVTKRDKVITLEWLTRSPPSPGAYAAWQALCRAYYVVTRLEFRADNRLLLKSRIRNQAIELLSELIKDSQTFFFEIVKIKGSALLPSLDDRSRQAEDALLDLEKLVAEFDEEGATIDNCIGEFAVSAEIAISNIHKMIVEYGRLQNQ